VAAQKDRDRLKRISSRSVQVGASQRARVVFGLEDYLKLSRPSPVDWRRFKDDLAKIIVQVKDLLDNMKQETVTLSLKKLTRRWSQA